MFALQSFANEYPNTAYSWDRNNEIVNSQTIDDGFIHAEVDLNNLDNDTVSLSKFEDIELSIYKSKKYGELNDFIVFYSKSIAKSTPVDLYELSPLFFKIFKRNCGYCNLIEDLPERSMNHNGEWCMVQEKKPRK